MSKKKSITTLSIAAGTAFVASLAMGNIANAAEGANPFAMNELSSGYMQLAEGKCGGKKQKKEMEGKCGEGKCGGAKEMNKNMEGKCGGNKAQTEGKCGEGKCGGSKTMNKGMSEGKCGGSNKAMGEGKCGGK